ncbi:MAG: PQQ-binding-like beta-propeller repeat protein [Bacteroidales bacterium]
MKQIKLFRRVVLIAVMAMSVLAASATRIVVLADTHVQPGNPNDIKLREAIVEINACDADAVVLAGDLSDEGSDAELTNIKGILDQIEKPFYIIPGNHELNWSQSATKTFFDLWGDDKFITEIDDLVVVGISCGPYMKMGDGHIKQEDLTWLDNQLANYKDSGKRIVSFNHYPITADLDNYKEYIKVLEKYNVISHVCGHHHKFLYYKGGDIDAVICRALNMKNGDFGYSYLDITEDSVLIYNKEVGVEPVKVISYKINDNLKPLVDDEVKEVVNIPEGYKVELVYKDDASIFTRLGIDDKMVFFGNSLGYVKAVNVKSGEVVWSYKTDASLFGRPAVMGKYVVIPSADKRLIWLKKKTGEFVKENKCEDGPYVADGVVDNSVLYQGGYKKFEAWSKKGDLIWRNTDFDNYCQAAAVVDGDDVIFGAWDTYLRCLDRKTGETKWKWNNGKSANMLGPGNVVPVVTKDRVIVVAPDRFMTCLDRETGKEIWRSNQYKVRESMGQSADGKVVYAKLMDGELLAVDGTSDIYNPLWVVDAGLGYEHAPCVVVESEGVVYMGSRSGRMVAIDAKKHEILWSMSLGTSAFNGWDVDEDGNLYASLIEGKIYKVSRK